MQIRLVGTKEIEKLVQGIQIFSAPCASAFSLPIAFFAQW
jgi:hypothetical protein